MGTKGESEPRGKRVRKERLQCASLINASLAIALQNLNFSQFAAGDGAMSMPAAARGRVAERSRAAARPTAAAAAAV
jgi:hypothetical protein